MKIYLLATGFGRSGTTIGCVYLHNNIDDARFLGEVGSWAVSQNYNNHVIIDSSKIYPKTLISTAIKLWKIKAHKVVVVNFHRDPIAVYRSYTDAQLRMGNNKVSRIRWLVNYRLTKLIGFLFRNFFKGYDVRFSSMKDDLNFLLSDCFSINTPTNINKFHYQERGNRLLESLEPGHEIIK